eukprot:4663269-Pyramimonas_sp.AAC.1
MLPDLPVLDHEQPTDTSDQSREQTICKACVEAITQATAVARPIVPYALRRQLQVSSIMTKEIWSITIAQRLLQMTGEAGMARSQPQGMIPKGDSHSPRDWLRQHCTTHSVDTFVASLSAGRPAPTCGYVPTKKGALQMTTASRLSPKAHLALQYRIRTQFRSD